MAMNIGTRILLSTEVTSKIDDEYKTRNMSMFSIDRTADVIGWGTNLAETFNKNIEDITTKTVSFDPSIPDGSETIPLKQILIEEIQRICPEIKTPINNIIYHKIKSKHSEFKYVYDITDSENNHYSFSILRKNAEWNELEKE